MKIMHPLKAALFAVLLLAAIVPAASAATITPSAAVSTPASALTRVGWMSYLNHEIAAGDKWLALLDDESFALDMEDAHMIGKADLALRNYARKEYRWYTTHTPSSSCFRAVWNSSKLEAHYGDLAMTDLARYWLNWPHVSESVWNRGMANYNRWTNQTNRTTALTNSTNC